MLSNLTGPAFEAFTFLDGAVAVASLNALWLAILWTCLDVTSLPFEVLVTLPPSRSGH